MSLLSLLSLIAHISNNANLLWFELKARRDMSSSSDSSDGRSYYDSDYNSDLDSSHPLADDCDRMVRALAGRAVS